MSRSIQDLAESGIAVYVHIPFCPTKCGYCDFNSYAMDGEIVGRTVRSLVQEIRSSALAGIPAKTIFFGGGTPTFLSEAELLSIFEAVLITHPPLPNTEITSEANPGTVDVQKFKAMRAAGFNRISLGAQSFLDSDLLRLGRVHQSGEIEKAVEAARNAGFENLNLDLMFGLPNQSTHAWNDNLNRALALRPDHLSLYCLTIEQNTAFYKEHLRGQLPLPDDDVQVEMYDDCVSRTAELNYEQYEISNFAMPGKECQHNICYWRGEAYAGYGPGAVGAVPIGDDFVRYTNLKHPERYSETVETKGNLRFEHEILSAETLRIEQIMLGMRMNSGISQKQLDIPSASLEKLQSRGWISQSGDQFSLTALGRHFCSEVALELI